MKNGGLIILYNTNTAIKLIEQIDTDIHYLLLLNIKTTQYVGILN